jgi:hypothetical protein
MDQADRDENVAIGRFQRMEKLWRDVAEAASRADAVLRMERALDQLPRPGRAMRPHRA